MRIEWAHLEHPVLNRAGIGTLLVKKSSKSADSWFSEESASYEDSNLWTVMREGTWRFSLCHFVLSGPEVLKITFSYRQWIDIHTKKTKSKSHSETEVSSLLNTKVSFLENSWFSQKKIYSKILGSNWTKIMAQVFRRCELTSSQRLLDSVFLFMPIATSRL